MSEAVIVAHGLWFPGVETKLLRIRLDNAGFAPHLFRFPTLRGTLEQNVLKLGRFADSIACTRLHFVGFSLGGVVTLRMLARSRARHVGRVVCLGSPLTGSQVASRVGGTELGRKVVGRSLGEHIDRGGIERWDQNIEVGIIAGTRNVGIGRLVDALPDRSDGTVAVEETQLPGATAHITLPVTHTQMLFDADVARQTIHFLRHGRFA
ncbi:MAG: alpha/beta hydrolase [Gammaproteobacteria bacterium]|jgi:pimeloyl-ACP methyl ester carboxylesterase